MWFRLKTLCSMLDTHCDTQNLQKKIIKCHYKLSVYNDEIKAIGKQIALRDDCIYD